jgi:long-subunit fatty acid transport protein
VYTNTNSVSSFYETRLKTSGIGATFGLTTPDFSKVVFNSENLSDFKIGVAFSFISQLSTDSTFSKKAQYILDTVSSGSTKMKIPIRINAGIGLRINKSYLVYLDYLHQDWSKYQLSSNYDDNLMSVNKISAGMEYRRNPSGMDFADLVIWRTGISYETTPYHLLGEHVKQYTLSGGVSLPISRENTLDFSVQYLIRGKNSAGLLKENMIKIGAGLSFGELWFLRYEK